MIEIVGIMIDCEEKMKYYDTNHMHLKKNITVIVETDKGIEFGRIVTEPHATDSSKLKEPLRKIIRIASKKDYVTYKANKKQIGRASGRDRV